MNNLDADQVAAFLAVLESGSYSAAGRQLGRDASLVSRRVTALEARLGIRLLQRSTRRVAPTEAGARFRDRMHAALDLMRAAEDEARNLSETPSGLLRLALPTAFGRMWIAPRIPDFMARYPAIALQVSYEDRFVDLIGERFDASIRIGQLQDNRLVGRRLAPTRRVLCASPAYLARHGEPKAPEELQRHDCLRFTPMHTNPVWHLQRSRQKRAIRVSGRLEADDMGALIAAAVAGQGILMAADWLVVRELAGKQLTTVLTDWEVEGESGVYLVRPTRDLPPAKTQAFCKWLINEFDDVPWKTLS